MKVVVDITPNGDYVVMETRSVRFLLRSAERWWKKCQGKALKIGKKKIS